MRKIAIINQKGGCGKTTTAVNLAACLAKKGKTVLLIDIDPQAHSTIGLKGLKENFQKTVFDVLCYPENTTLNDIIVPVAENLSLVPSHVILAAAEQQLSGVLGREDRLRDSLAELHNSYQYIIIDCPPSIGLLTFNALKACTQAIVPIEPSIYSLHGLSQLLETVEILRSEQGHAVSIKALATMINMRTLFCREIIKNIEDNFGANCYRTMIHYTVKLKEAALHAMPIISYDRACAGSEDYRCLAEEVIAEEFIVTGDMEDTVKVQYSGPQKAENGVVFTLKAPCEAKVRIVGDFNAWSAEHGEMRYEKEDRVWKKVVPLSPGEYQYKFIIDDEWISDPANPQEADNRFGGKNSLIRIN